MENTKERRENVEWEVAGVGVRERMVMRGENGNGVETATGRNGDCCWWREIEMA